MRRRDARKLAAQVTQWRTDDGPLRAAAGLLHHGFTGIPELEAVAAELAWDLSYADAARRLADGERYFAGADDR